MKSLLNKVEKKYDPKYRHFDSEKIELYIKNSSNEVITKMISTVFEEICKKPNIFRFFFEELITHEYYQKLYATSRLRNMRNSAYSLKDRENSSTQYNNLINLSVDNNHPIIILLNFFLKISDKDIIKSNTKNFNNEFFYLSRYYAFWDLFSLAIYSSREKIDLYLEIFNISLMQRELWDKPYVNCYFYQGYEKIGVRGIKPTVDRLQRLEIEKWVDNLKEANVLDIGANCCFMGMELAHKVKSVNCLELNPYTLQIAHLVNKFLNIKNIKYELCDFFEWDEDKQYDIILSLATHKTKDGKYNPSIKDHFSKIWKHLKPKGILIFESHYAEDDSYGIKASQAYFDIISYKVIDKFVASQDIDKLVIILRKKEFNKDFDDKFNLKKAITCRRFEIIDS